MGTKENQSSGAEEVQVFELTMDNPEDQDELNRQFRKPGEPDRCTPAKTEEAAQGNSATEAPDSGP